MKNKNLELDFELGIELGEDEQVSVDGGTGPSHTYSAVCYMTSKRMPSYMCSVYCFCDPQFSKQYTRCLTHQKC